MNRSSAPRGIAAVLGRILPAIAPALAIAACGAGETSPPAPGDYGAFGNPVRVTIDGYADNAMEPFLSRDGATLFFNNDAGGPTDKDLFYATFVDNATFRFEGAIAAINTSAVDGAPTMDNANTFYHVSTAAYNPPASYATIFAGSWTGGTVSGSAPLAGLTIATPGILYFDVEVSPDNAALYLSEGDFRGGGVPSSSDIVVAVNSGAGFSRAADSAAIMANVNSARLEYAPAVSADGLELFFTRLDPATGDARIHRAARSTPTGAFGPPQPVAAITGFVEGPALSPDGKALYYHRRDAATGTFGIWRVTRP